MTFRIYTSHPNKIGRENVQDYANVAQIRRQQIIINAKRNERP